MLYHGYELTPNASHMPPENTSRMPRKLQAACHALPPPPPCGALIWANTVFPQMVSLTHVVWLFDFFFPITLGFDFYFFQNLEIRKKKPLDSDLFIFCWLKKIPWNRRTIRFWCFEHFQNKQKKKKALRFRCFQTSGNFHEITDSFTKGYFDG
jgi:hypothetical protein